MELPQPEEPQEKEPERPEADFGNPRVCIGNCDICRFCDNSENRR